jgi:hypothetical protein
MGFLCLLRRDFSCWVRLENSTEVGGRILWTWKGFEFFGVLFCCCR